MCLCQCPCLCLCLYLGLCIWLSLCLFLGLFICSSFSLCIVFVINCLFALPHKSGKDSSKNIAEKAESNARDEVSPRAEVEEVQVEPSVISPLCLYVFVLCLSDYMLVILALRAKEEVEQVNHGISCL